jgi:Tfp pilus assembly protein PilX
MNARSLLSRRDERGAALVLVIAFMILIGAIGAAVVASVTSGVADRAVLDQARNREYDADAAIETWVMQIRGGVTGTCPTSTNHFASINGGPGTGDIHIDCASADEVIIGPNGEFVQQRNLVFTACLKTGAGTDGIPCTQSTGATNSAIINAQINFQGTSAPLTTFVQSWSVNR